MVAVWAALGVDPVCAYDDILADLQRALTAVTGAAAVL
jgi:hypothetical protein